jgi:hypothetical protein
MFRFREQKTRLPSTHGMSRFRAEPLQRTFSPRWRYSYSIPVSRPLSRVISWAAPNRRPGREAEISGAQVIDAADRLELVRVRLIWTHAAIAGWPSDGSA